MTDYSHTSSSAYKIDRKKFDENWDRIYEKKQEDKELEFIDKLDSDDVEEG